MCVCVWSGGERRGGGGEGRGREGKGGEGRGREGKGGEGSDKQVTGTKERVCDKALC